MRGVIETPIDFDCYCIALIAGGCWMPLDTFERSLIKDRVAARWGGDHKGSRLAPAVGGLDVAWVVGGGDRADAVGFDHAGVGVVGFVGD